VKQVIFWIRVDLRLDKPLTVLDESHAVHSEAALGALMEFGVTAETEERARKIVEDWFGADERFRGLTYRLEFEYIGEIDRSELQSEVYADEDVADGLLADPANKGLWYRTGVGWYDEEDD
jgi:hypothetical protein